MYSWNNNCVILVLALNEIYYQLTGNVKMNNDARE